MISAVARESGGREDAQVQLVHQVVPQRPADQGGAAADADVLAGLLGEVRLGPVLRRLHNAVQGDELPGEDLAHLGLLGRSVVAHTLSPTTDSVKTTFFS